MFIKDAREHYFFHHFLFVFLFFLLTVNFADSQNSIKVKTSIWEDFKSDNKIFLNDGISFFTLPTRFTGRDWLYTLGVCGSDSRYYAI